MNEPAVKSRAVSRAAEAATALLLMSLFLAWSTHRISHPGLHSDEMLFATPALQAGGATYDPWFHLPLMVGGYLGALKSYLFMPIFAVMDPGPAVIRVPSVLLAGAALLGFWLFLRWIAGRGALLMLALVVLDPSYTFAARVDWGPTVLMQVFKAAALLALFQLVEHGRPGRLWLLTLIALLGLYDKLNFIWVMNALALGALAAHGRRLFELARTQPRRFWPPAVVLAVATGAVFVYAIVSLLPETHPQQAGMTPLQRLGFTLSVIARTFDGTWIHQWIVLQPIGRWPVALALHALLLAAVGVVIASWRRTTWSAPETRLLRWLVFCVVAEVSVVAQLAATRAFWGSHHVLVLWPFPQAAAALAVTLAWRRTSGTATARRVLIAGTAGAAAVILAGQVRAAVAYERDIYGVSSTPNPLFTPEIYELSRFLGPRLPRVASVITADWGLRYPLRVLAPAGQRDKIRDFWAAFRDYGRGEGRTLYKEWFEGRSVIVVSYLPQRRVFADSDENWRRFLQKHLEPRGGVRRTTLGCYEIVCVAPDSSADELCATSGGSRRK